jgi:serine protease Do
MAPLEAATSLVLLEFAESYGLGFVAPNGRIISCFHVVVDEHEVTAHFADGRAVPVERVAAIDTKRDLVVLDVGELDAPPVRVSSSRLAEEETPVTVFGMVQAEGRARWVEARIEALQVVGNGLSVYRLTGSIPPDASGGPLVGPDGVTLGVVTVAEGDEGLVSLGVPWRYVEPLLLKNQGLPLASLARATRKSPARRVPKHPVSLLEGSNPMGLVATTQAIVGAIREGAPAYNDGDVERCYRLYAEAARRLIDSRADCPGVRQALREGLNRAAGLPDVDHQAWAMRDAFDGLLAVIERFINDRPTPATPKGKPTLLN